MLLDFNSPFFWLSLGLGIILVEFLLPGIFLLWIGAAGVLVALPAYFFPNVAAYKLVLFFIISMGFSLWVGIKYQTKRKDAANTLNKGISAYLGAEAVVATKPNNGNPFIRIYLGGTSYEAQCEDHVSINERVKVVSVDNGNIKVKKLTNINDPCVKSEIN